MDSIDSLDPTDSNHIGSGFGDQVRGEQQALKRAGVGPPAVEFVPGHLAAADVMVVDIGDLEFAAARGHESLDHVKDGGVVKIDADDGHVRPRRGRLFLDIDDTVAVELRHAESLRVGHAFEQYLGTAALKAVLVGGGTDIALDDIVAEYHTDRFVVGKMLDQPERVGDTALALLIRIVEMLEAEIPPVSQQFEKMQFLLQKIKQ